MTQIEVKEFLQKIKARYQEFKIDEPFIIREWIESLAPYDKADIYEKFEEHLSNESVQKEVPKIQVLTKWLSTSEDKKNKTKHISGTFYCRYCKEKCSSTYILQMHEERCSRQRYISRMADKLAINILDFYPNFFKGISLIELDEKYDSFILKIIEKEKELHCLSAYEKAGIKAYYNNVIKKKGNA